MIGLSPAHAERFLAHYRLWKMSPENTDVVEVGVGDGTSLLTWAHFLEIAKSTRAIYGFDTFSGIPLPSPEDGGSLDRVERRQGGQFRACLNEVVDQISSFQAQSASKVNRVTLIEGDVSETIPRFVAGRSPDFKVGLLHLDADVYAPTKSALVHIWPFMPRGAVVVLDEYGDPDWPGETKAVDEFLKGRPEKVMPVPYATRPTGYLVKGTP